MLHCCLPEPSYQSQAYLKEEPQLTNISNLCNENWNIPGSLFMFTPCADSPIPM